MLRTWTATAAVSMLLVAGCGGDDASTDTDAGAPQDAAPTTEQMAPSEPATDMSTDMSTDMGADASGEVTVSVAETDLGPVLVDGEGMTLYMFDPDEQGESVCYDDCAVAWPPLVADSGATAGEGADDALLGAVERTDGTQQVTYNDWPLYYWQDDTAPGDTTGQAVNDVWWVLDAAGEPIRQ